MKLDYSAKAFAVFVLVAVLAAGLISAEGSAVAQTGDLGGSAVADAAGDVSDLDGAGVAAVPIELPLGESDLVGSVMYRRSGEFERFDTDHDIDPPPGVGGASGASGASSTSEDREIVGSHYLLGDTFNVRVPASFAGKPAGVFAFSFNHVVLQAGSGRFTADCGNQRVFAYRDSGAGRWRCDLDFGNSASGWAEAAASAAQVSIAAAWSDEGCSNGEYGIEINNREPLLVADCRALLAVKHHWLDEHPENRDGLKSKHALWSWGSGDIEGWRGVRVGGFYMTAAQFRDNCREKKEDSDIKCPRRVLGVDLSVHGHGEISGKVPEELGGVGNSGSGDCKEVAGPGLGFRFVGFAGVGCGLGALEVLDLGGNLLDGGIPWQLGNLSAAPCNPSYGTPELDVLAASSLGLFVLALLAAPFSGGASLTLGIIGVTVGAASVFVDVNVPLDEYLFDCLDASGAPSRGFGSGRRGDEVAEVALERASVVHSFSGAEVVGDQVDEGGKALVPGVLLGFETAGELVSGVPDDEWIEIRVGDAVRRVRAGAVKVAGRVAGFVGAVLDVKDIVRGLFGTEEREFLHLDRSQLQILDLSGNKLSGSVPAEIGNLDSLQYFSLKENDLSGSIPGNAGRGGKPVHDRLVLFDVSGNSFSGAVPSLLSTRLRTVNFSDNKLGGSVPSSLVLSLGLVHLDLSGNRLSGELPASIANMEHLWLLDLSNNSLSGMVPSAVGKRHKTNCRFLGFLCDHRVAADRLWEIDLSDNLFHGEIPGNLGNISRLSLLDLRHNCFVGDVPGKLLEKSSAGKLDLNYDHSPRDSDTAIITAACGPCFEGTYLPDDADEDLKRDCVVLLGLKNHWGGGSFPYRWGETGQTKMSSWTGVVLKNPDDLSKSRNRVAGLELSNLGLTGTVPSSLGELRGLRTLRLAGNRLTGGIPASFSELSDLEALDLSNNMLSGEIPDDVGGWDSDLYVPGLTDLDLSHNMLSGEVPVGIAHRLTSIVNLDLSHNRLTGPIPGQLSNDPDSVWNLSKIFSGRIAIGNLKNLKVLDLSHNLLSGKLPGNIRNSSHIFKNLGDFPYGGSLESLLLNNNCLTLEQSAVKEIREAEIFLKVENNPSEARCVSGGCSGGVLVADPSLNPGLAADCEVLLELSEHWAASASVGSWGTGNDKRINRWQGVTVSDGRVAELELPGKGLSGDIPERIGGLAGLRNLDLSGNALSGEIPASLRYPASLQTLDLSDNSLSGPIPEGLGDLASLRTLDLRENSLSGPIPEGLGDLASLRTLDLRENRLSGGIPASLGRLSRLRSLKLQNNKLTGAIPEELADIRGFSDAEAVNLSSNCLLGPVPASLARVVSARGNLFGTEGDNPICGDPCSDGTFVSSATQESQSVVAPPLADDCRALWAVRKRWHAAGPTVVARPQQWGTAAHQDITTWPGVTVARGRVRELRLPAQSGASANTRLRGVVPAALGDLTALEVLNLRGHRLWGEIPVELDRLENLRKLNLSSNRLSGPVPASFSGLESLVMLNLSHNRLTGQIPSLTTLSSAASAIPTLVLPQQLERLFLNDNDFGGIIPPQITYHTNLKKLNLSNNNLHGPIPVSIASLTRLTDLRLNHNSLTGTPPQRLESLRSLLYLHIQNNCLTGQDPGPALTRAILAAELAARAEHLASSLTAAEISIASPDIKTVNNLFHDATTKNKTCARICYDSVIDPDNNTKLVQDCETLLAIRDQWATQTILPEGKDSAMSTWGGSGDRKLYINTWQGVTLKNNRIAGLDLSGHALTSPVPPQLANLTALTSLNLADNDLSNFPAPALELEKLQELDLSDNRLADLPANISKLTELTSLNLADNSITNFPAPVQELEELQELDLSDNRLAELPASIEKLAALSSLDLNNNRIAALPASISNLKSLTSLNLASNLIASLPFTTGSFPDLTYLNASGNALTAIPDAISNMTNLQTLDLSENNIQSPVTNLIRNLTRLTHLNLSHNKFTGAIPPEIGNLRSLIYLDLSSSGLSGDILAQIGNLRNLEYLDLSNTGLTGPILPSAIGNLRNLEHLGLSDNYLSGHIPSAIGNLRNLEYLDLSDNYLSGHIPSAIGNLRNLEHLDLSYNASISGHIPSEIGNLRNLKLLWLNVNRLSGHIPSEIGNLRNLEYLELSDNYLSGPIPSEIGNLRSLEYLNLFLNALSGHIPPEIGNLRKLKYLNLFVSGNLSGPIPPEIGNLQNLEHLELELDVGGDDLPGPIPPEIGNLRSLKYLNLYANLSGSIPSEIGNLHNLEYLNLIHSGGLSDSEGLSGSIPSEIGNLRNLEHLDLSVHNLSGSIPPEIGNLHNLEYLGLSNNDLSGPIPPEISNLRNLEILQLHNNDLCGPIPTITSRKIRSFSYIDNPSYTGNPRLGSPCP